MNLSEERRKERERMEKRRIEVQLSCPHPEVLEAEYSPAIALFHAEPSFRVCTSCGFAEKGWNCGHQILKLCSRKVSRNEAFDYVVGSLHPNARFVRDGDIFDKTILYCRAVCGEEMIDDA